MTIDEIRIEGEENGFHLVIFTDDGETHHYRIGLPDQFDAEVRRTIGAWLAEGEAAQGTMMLRHGDGTPYMDALDYHDTMSGLYDNRAGK